MPTRRLFFALWPDDRIRAGIVARRELLGPISRRRVPDHNLHLTLLFLGDQPAERVGDIETAAAGVAGRACTLCLDRIGWFPGARVAWLGGDAPLPLMQLVEDLGSAVKPLGLRFDERRFRPHVTLYRQVSRRPGLRAIEPLEWPAREFVLVESRPGQPYRCLERWRLNSGLDDGQ
jgi:RNA 2',3'-cyclic 3'-phosphodiesterase